MFFYNMHARTYILLVPRSTLQDVGNGRLVHVDHDPEAEAQIRDVAGDFGAGRVDRRRVGVGRRESVRLVDERVDDPTTMAVTA